jgi:hypothetical protein
MKCIGCNLRASLKIKPASGHRFILLDKNLGSPHHGVVDMTWKYSGSGVTAIGLPGEIQRIDAHKHIDALEIDGDRVGLQADQLDPEAQRNKGRYSLRVDSENYLLITPCRLAGPLLKITDHRLYNIDTLFALLQEAIGNCPHRYQGDD